MVYAENTKAVSPMQKKKKIAEEVEVWKRPIKNSLSMEKIACRNQAERSDSKKTFSFNWDL